VDAASAGPWADRPSPHRLDGRSRSALRPLLGSRRSAAYAVTADRALANDAVQEAIQKAFGSLDRFDDDIAGVLGLLQADQPRIQPSRRAESRDSGRIVEGALAARTPSRKPIFYAQVFEPRKTRLFTDRGCAPRPDMTRFRRAKPKRVTFAAYSSQEGPPFDVSNSHDQRRTGRRAALLVAAAGAAGASLATTATGAPFAGRDSDGTASA
jgi:hypothetical protein